MSPREGHLCGGGQYSEKSKTELVIDFDKLKQELSDYIVEGAEERYQFTWPDKKKAILTANSKINKTLRPCREESVNFDTTENLYIEGDNLEVLKLLQETYLGKVKMIYIDPPYNTGSDFVYRDDFAIDQEKYKDNSGQFDEDGNRMVQNLESNGRYHTDWLNMMYPRLKLARDLLADDGVIFISIDDKEIHNLKKICDEIFGTNSYIDIFNWAKTETPANLSKKSKKIIEYVLCYQKNKDKEKFKGIQKDSKSANGLLNQTNSIGVLKFEANCVKTSIDDGMILKGMYGTEAYSVELLEDTEVCNGVFIKPVILKAKFKWSQTNLEKELKNGTTIRIPTMKFSPSYEKKEYDAEVPSNLINNKVNVGTNENAGTYLQELFDGKKIFSFPKPTSLIEYLLSFNDNEESYTVMDFFSGSASTAEAIYNINKKNGYNKLKYILVQLPENLDISLKYAENNNQKEIIMNAIEFLDSMNKPHTICEIGKERIRRAGAKIKSEHPEAQDLDIGFRVLKCDSSNMKDVYYTPADTINMNMFDLVDNVKEDRTAEDLLFQCMLEFDAPLSSAIETMTIGDKTVYNVAGGHLMACFDTDVTEEVITEVAKLEPSYFVMRDSSLANDSVAANFEQIFKTYSPSTERRVL